LARCTCFQTHAALRHSTADCSRLKCRRSHLLIRHSISLVASRSGNGSTNTPLRSFFTLPPVAVGGLSIVMTVSVCLSAGISPELYQFFSHVTYVRGSVLLWQHCDMLCTSGLWMTSYLHIMSICERVGVTLLKQPASLMVQPGG